ncbi:hypothetical protein ILYODFUR_018554 [Ilyodon furcidens]|uniref:Uncharacterized protein n=1 Tax=Ilyodon furcidens TaxID=33524 RepID=A0ABV0VF52_9TELE
MHEPTQLRRLDVKEQPVYFELSQYDRAPHSTISLRQRSSTLHSTGKCWNIDRLITTFLSISHSISPLLLSQTPRYFTILLGAETYAWFGKRNLPFSIGEQWPQA